MKKKIDLLAAALVEQSGSPGGLIQAEAEAITTDSDQYPWNTLTP
jgi:hypothetical protein